MLVEFVIAGSVLFVMYMTMDYYMQKAKRSVDTRNNILSGLYFIMDMGPSVTAFVAVAIVIMPNNVTVLQLVIVFFFGIMLKRGGRKMKTLFFRKLDLKDKS